MMDPRDYILSRVSNPVDPQAELKRYLRQRLLGERAPASDVTIEAPAIEDVPAVGAPATSPADAARSRAAQVMGETPIVVDGSPTLDNLPRQERGSGLSREIKLQNNQERNKKLSLNLPMDPDDVRRSMEVFTGNGDDQPGVPAYQAQEQGIQDLQDMVRASVETTTPQTDITPAMALVDQWTGSKLTPSYKAPETAAAQKARILGAQSKIQDDRRDLFKSLLGTVTAQKGGGTYLDGSGVKALLETQAKAEDPRKTEKAPKTPRNQFGPAYNATMRNKSVVDLQTSLASLGAAKELLSVANPQADAMFVTKLLRAMGDTHISNVDKSDARRNMGGVGAKFDQLWQDLQTGTLDPANRANYFLLLNAVERSQKKRLGGLTKTVNNIGDGFGLGEGQKKQLRQATIGDDEENAASQSEPGVKAAGKAPHEMTPAERRARIKELEAKAKAKGGKK